MNILREIKETAYLSTTKSEQYRRIMRIFFNEYEKMNFHLYKEDILNKIEGFPEFENYTIEKIKSDLDSLVDWGNLIAIQDTKKVNTIEEFKNREYRYSMSEKAVVIERMTITLENIHFESGNLSTNYISRMISNLEEISFLFSRNASDDSIYDCWRIIQEDFKQINQNYQDYLKEFYSKKSEELMKTTEFLLYKEKFINILKNFIKNLQKYSSKMEEILKKIEFQMEDKILELIIEKEFEKQELNLNNEFKVDENFKNRLRENIIGKWQSLKNWFISNEKRKSEYRQIMNITEEIIGRIVQEAFFITQRENWGNERKAEYRKFIGLFIDCQDIKEAHKLASHLFGIQKIRHFNLRAPNTISSESSVYDEGEDKNRNYMEYILESHNRTYKPRVEKTGFEDRRELKEKLRLEYKRKLENDRKMITQYLDKGILDISQIDEEVSAEFRKFILNLITMANLSSDKISRTEYGQRYKIIETNEKMVLKCEDGALEMPKYIFEFLED